MIKLIGFGLVSTELRSFHHTSDGNQSTIPGKEIKKGVEKGYLLKTVGRLQATLPILGINIKATTPAIWKVG